MAKLKAPLLSLGASGAIGKALVFFPWKGLDCVREYVIPANPDTQDQKDQRGYLRDAITDIHDAQVAVANPLVEADKSAYSLLGSLQPTPRTWFNTIVRQWLKQKVAGLLGTTFRGCYATGAATQLTVQVQSDECDGVKITQGRFFYGTSKTAMLTSLGATADIPNDRFFAVITGLTDGVKYFWQFRSDLTNPYDGCRSGIYADKAGA